MGKKEFVGTPSSTVTNEDIKGGRVVTNTYDELDPELIKKHIAGTKENLISSEGDYTPFNPNKPKANLSHQARLKGYNDKLLHALEVAHPKKFKEYSAKLNTTNDPREKTKLAEEYALANTDFYIDQSKIFNPKQYEDYQKVRKYVDEMYGYKNLGTDVEKDKYGGRMAAKYSTPLVDVEASSFIHTGTQDQEKNERTTKTYKKELGYDVDAGEYTVKFTDPKVQERIETKPIPNPTEQGVGFKGMQEGKGTEFQNAAQAQKEAQAAKEALNTNIVTGIPKKRKGTDNTIPKLFLGGSNISEETKTNTTGYGALGAAALQMGGEIANDNVRNPSSSNPYLKKEVSVGGAVASGAGTGLALGATTGNPIIAAAGTVIGAGAGLYKGLSQNKKIKKDNAAAETLWSNEQRNKLFAKTPNTQAPLAKKGVDFTAKVEQGEVKVAKVLNTKNSKPEFKLTADWTSNIYPKHEEGGEPVVTVKGPDKSKGLLGEAVITAKDGQKVKDALRLGNHDFVSSVVDKLPKNLPTTAKAKDGINWTTTPKVGEYTYSTVDEEGLPITTNAKLKMKTNLTTPNTTTLASKTPQLNGSTFNKGSNIDKKKNIDFIPVMSQLGPMTDIARGLTGKVDDPLHQSVTPSRIAHVNTLPEQFNRINKEKQILGANQTTSSQQNFGRRVQAASEAQRQIQDASSAHAQQATAIENLNADRKFQSDVLNNQYAKTAFDDKQMGEAYRQSLIDKGISGSIKATQSMQEQKNAHLRDLEFSKYLSTGEYAWNETDGFYHIKNSDGTMRKSKTKPAAGKERS